MSLKKKKEAKMSYTAFSVYFKTQHISAEGVNIQYCHKSISVFDLDLVSMKLDHTQKGFSVRGLDFGFWLAGHS